MSAAGALESKIDAPRTRKSIQYRVCEISGLGSLDAGARCNADPLSPLLIKHGVRDMLRQRLYGLALGWEDLNHHGALRCDAAMQTAVGVDRKVASAPTPCRLQTWADRDTAWRLHDVLAQQFIASFKNAPWGLVLLALAGGLTVAFSGYRHACA